MLHLKTLATGVACCAGWPIGRGLARGGGRRAERRGCCGDEQGVVRDDDGRAGQAAGGGQGTQRISVWVCGWLLAYPYPYLHLARVPVPQTQLAPAACCFASARLLSNQLENASLLLETGVVVALIEFSAHRVGLLREERWWCHVATKQEQF